MRILWLLSGLTVALTGCAQLKPNPDPIEGITYFSTSELLEKRAGLQHELSYYGGEPETLTNRRKLGTLKDETADLYHRKLLQIDRELQRRYESGDKDALVEPDKAEAVGTVPATEAPAAASKP